MIDVKSCQAGVPVGLVSVLGWTRCGPVSMLGWTRTTHMVRAGTGLGVSSPLDPQTSRVLFRAAFGRGRCRARFSKFRGEAQGAPEDIDRRWPPRAPIILRISQKVRAGLASGGNIVASDPSVWGRREWRSAAEPPFCHRTFRSSSLAEMGAKAVTAPSEPSLKRPSSSEIAFDGPQANPLIDFKRSATKPTPHLRRQLSLGGGLYGVANRYFETSFSRPPTLARPSGQAVHAWLQWALASYFMMFFGPPSED